MMEHYKIIDGSRMKPYIPYEQLKVYQLKDGDTLVAALTVNVNNYTEVYKLGFNVPEDRHSEEIISFYLNRNANIGGLSMLYDLLYFGADEAVKRDVVVWYAVSPKKMVKFYKRFYGTIIDQKEVDGEMEHLFTFDLLGQLKHLKAG
jgi:hypothetical protein